MTSRIFRSVVQDSAIYFQVQSENPKLLKKLCEELNGEFSEYSCSFNGFSAKNLQEREYTHDPATAPYNNPSCGCIKSEQILDRCYGFFFQEQALRSVVYNLLLLHVRAGKILNNNKTTLKYKVSMKEKDKEFLYFISETNEYRVKAFVNCLNFTNEN